MSAMNWTFFRAFVKSPLVVASAIPSSGMLERRVIRHLGLAKARVIVEFGAGTGGLTRAMLDGMRSDARLIAIEWTRDFIGVLREIDDPRLEVINDCASNINEQLAARGLAGADAIVSGIPFSTMPPELCEEIATNLSSALNEDGRFVAYQFSERVCRYVSPYLGVPTIEHELINIPPMRVFSWRKTDAWRAPAVIGHA